MPDDESWNELERALEEHPAKWMIWEGPPTDEITARLQSLGLGSVVFKPCGNNPESGDFLTVGQRNVQNLKRIFAE